ncbi:MAG: hypothetical protein KF753_05490 [Caldilineaceae bacterium]|nr:hypothetical protein [Caldilineaceae bacterium]
MTVKRTLTLLLFVLLALGLAACGEDKPTATPEPAAATDTPVPPTDTPVPPTNTPAPAAVAAIDTPTPAAGEASSFAAPNDILKSYRTKGQFLITTTFQDGTSTSQDMQLEGAFVRTDNAYGSDESFQMTVNESGNVEQVSIYKIGEWVSANSQGEWITVGRDNAGLFTAMSDIFTSFVDGFVLESSEADNLGDETVDGVTATHYQIQDTTIFTRMAEMAPDAEEVIDKAEMNVWVAKEGGYVVKYTVLAEVSNVMETNAAGEEVATTQSVNWSYQIYDANADITIALPADAPEPGVVSVPGFAEGEFPVPEGGKLAANMIGMPEVTSDLTQEELVKFYSDALTALGWTFSGDFGFYEVTKGDVSFSLFIDTADNGKGRAQVFAE